MATDVLAMMDQESTRAKSSVGGRQPTFLLLKDKQKALVRPLFNLDQAVVLKMHNKFNQADPKQSINAVCAGANCLHCAAAAAGDKKLTAGVSFLLPVYVYAMKQQDDKGVWADVVYTDAEGKEQTISGLRLIELKAYGTINDVFQFFRSYYAENEPHTITACDFIIERKGAGQTTTYVTLPKQPKPMSEQAHAAIPTALDVRVMVETVCPPALAGGTPANPFVNVPAQNGAAPSSAGDSIPDF